MSDYNYVIRENGMPKMLSVDMPFQFLDIEDILENEYPYISHSIKKENYELENIDCLFFDEILFENKVVGFVAFDVDEEFSILLTECYIMPEFRGNRLFFNAIEKLNFLGNRLSIVQPNRKIVELLVDFAFAKYVSDDIVVSGIDFYFDDFNIKSSLNRNLIDSLPLVSNYYDLSICSTILVDGDDVIYHDMLQDDLKNYGQRKELGEEYFNEIKSLFLKNHEEFENLISQLALELPESEFSFDQMVGRGNALSDYMMAMVEDGLITYDMAFEIKDKLTQEYDAGEISDDQELNTRLFELVHNVNLQQNIDFNEFKSILPFLDGGNQEFKLFNAFIDSIGDNDKLGNEVLKLLLEDEIDMDKFSELLENNSEFNPLLNLINPYNNEDFVLADDDIDLLMDFQDDLKGEDFFEMDTDFFDESEREIFFQVLCENQDKPYRVDNSLDYDDFSLYENLEMYKVLVLFKQQQDFIGAIVGVNFDSLDKEDEVEQRLLDNNLIDDSVDYDNWDDFADNYLTVSDIKDLLRKNNLKVSGRKKELVDRVRENNLSLDEFNTIDYRFTDNADEFLTKNSWMGFYNFFLIPYDLRDFYNFYKQHDGDIINISLDYLDEHFDLADKHDDIDALEACVNVKRLINLVGDEFMNRGNFE